MYFKSTKLRHKHTLLLQVEYTYFSTDTMKHWEHDKRRNDRRDSVADATTSRLNQDINNSHQTPKLAQQTTCALCHLHIATQGAALHVMV